MNGSEIESHSYQVPLNGLVLMGGQSIRMKKDKASISYFNKPQHQYVKELLEPLCNKVFFSVREIHNSLTREDRQITDQFLDIGPFGGILSAFQVDPNSAWLVLAIDIPGIGKEELKKLTDARQTQLYATAFLNPETKLPDPLCTIYEPRAYKALLELYDLGYHSPRKMLTNFPVHSLSLAQSKALKNINSPKEKEDFLKTLKK